MTVPDARDFQQLHPIGQFGAFNCTAECAAWVSTAAGHPTTGERVRANTNEPTPDKHSPGLNLHQVDDALLKITGGKMNLDVETGHSISDAESQIVDGSWAIVQVNRGVLVAAGFDGGNQFTGGHAVTVHYVNGAPVIGDPLVPFYQRVGWPTLWRAAANLVIDSQGHKVGTGKANVAFTRDLTADYTARIAPTKLHPNKGFYSFTLFNGKRIVARHPHHTRTVIAGDCTPPDWKPWPGHAGRNLVQFTSGPKKGWWINAKYATKVPGAKP